MPHRSAAPDVVLPQSDGSPPKKTTKPHVKADYERLAKLEFPGFTAEVRTVGDKVFEVRQKTADHPRLWAVVTIKPCFDCLPMELAKWKAKEQELKATNLGILNSATRDIDPFLTANERELFFVSTRTGRSELLRAVRCAAQ